VNNQPFLSPYVEISLDALAHNFFQIKNVIPAATGIIAVVKDNAYGCGSVPVCHVLERLGASWFAVAKPHEAYALRENGITRPILVLGSCSPDDIVRGSAKNITFALNDYNTIALWKSLKCPIRFHLKVDTGMGRMGILPEQISDVIQALDGEQNLTLDGVFTHCANADNPETTDFISSQLALLRKVMDTLNNHGIHPPCIHYASSAAIMRYPHEECTLVRPGISLYGCKPDPQQEFSLNTKPVFSLKARVVKIKRVPAHTPISYGSTYVTSAETVIATIALGYGQGYPRRLSNKGGVLIHGKKYPLAGRVTMDYIMVDAGNTTDIVVGDEVVAIGCQGTECITPDDVALQCGTIAYEIMCAVSPLVDRYYMLDNTVQHYEPAKAF
jgi:alanine racemase